MTKTTLEELVNKGYSSREIAKNQNVGQTTVRYYLKKYGLKTNYIGKTFIKKVSNTKFKKISKFSLINWTKIQESYDNGMTWKEICKLYKLCNASLSWGQKNNKFITRSHSEAAELSHNSNKYNYSLYRTAEHRKRMAKFGGLKEKSGRCKKYLYTKKDGSKVWLQGSWELKLASFFDELNIEWDKNKNGFPYVFENKDRKYYPDFYVLGKYVEVKGYQTNQDIEKWKQFQYPLVILKKEGMKDLNSWYQQNF